MKIIVPFFTVLALILIAYLGAGSESMRTILGIVIPYVALTVFVVGFINRIFYWARSPVPFRIPTTSGQAKSLPWIKQNKLDCPSSTLGVLGRMALEVLLFRSLFKNTKAELGKEGTIAYGSSKWLWLGGIVFHYSFLLVLVRHYRFFIDPVPSLVVFLENIDGFFQVMLPTFYLTSLGLVAGVLYLLIRRFSAQMKFISQPADYFPLYLILSIAVTGIWMRYVDRQDIVSIKAVIQGLTSFSPNYEAMLAVGSTFYIHIFLVCVLAMYFPFSKLMHFGGVFLSPTRNLATNSREVRHINPWNPDVKIRTYEEYEEEFREKMKKADLPLEKE